MAMNSIISIVSFSDFAITVVAFGYLLKRTGRSLWWLILAFTPPVLGMIVLLCILAFCRWPAFDEKKAS
jgi:hypothetical protein